MMIVSWLIVFLTLKFTTDILALESVCSRMKATTHSYSYYVQGSYQSSYSCGLFGWSRCYRTHYNSQLSYGIQTLYHLEYVCCDGYSGNVTEMCSPICLNCSESHYCLAPYICACPHDGSGNGCIEPPQNVSLLATGWNSLELTWDPPPEGEVSLYFILFEGETIFINSTANNSVLGGLSPFSTYNCCIAANTTFGASQLYCVSETTFETVPGSPPLNMSVSAVNSTTLNIEWSVPSSPNGVIIFYTIYVNEIPTVTVTAIGDKQNIDVGGFSPNQMVTVSISASTKVGEGPLTPAQGVVTHESVPGEVRNMRVVAISDHSIHVLWHPPAKPNGVLTGFTVSVNNLINITDTVAYAVDPTVYEIIIDGIGPYIRYMISVTASTSVGVGEHTQITIYTQEGAPLHSLSNTTSNRSSAHTASIQWEKMSIQDLRGWLVSYDIGFSSVANEYDCSINKSTSFYFTWSVNQEEYNVSELSPSLQYCVWVSARTSAGRGPPSLTFIPWFKNSIISLRVERQGCQDWIVHNPSKSIDDFIRDISRGIEYTCHCEFHIDYVADPQLTCTEENIVLFECRLISTQMRDSSLLKGDFESWAVGETTVIVRGESLKVVRTTSNNYPSPSLVTENLELQSSQHVAFSTFGGALGGMGAVIVIILVVTTTILLYRKVRKATGSSNVNLSQPSTVNYNISSSHDMASLKLDESKEVELPKGFQDDDNIYDNPDLLSLKEPKSAYQENSFLGPSYRDKKNSSGGHIKVMYDN